MREVKIKGIYKHFKGDYYIVEDIIYHCENLEKMVAYRALYGDGKLLARSYNEFLEEVDHNKYPNVDQQYRFELQDIQSVRESFDNK